MSSVLEIRKSLLLILLTLLLCVPLPSVFAQPFTVSGRIFRDIGLGNFDGTRNGTDPGVGGVTVTAYDAAGAAITATSFNLDCRAAGNPVAACLGVNNPPRGFYELVLPLGGEYRLEFTDPANPAGPMPRGYQPGVFSATGSETSVQFIDVTADIINQDFALEIVTDYCETNPWLMLPCYASGDPLTTTPHATDAATQNVLAAIRYNDNGANTTAFTVEAPADERTLAIGQEVGTLWGSAYHRESQSLFSAALLKRYSGLGPGGIGQIYRVPFALDGTQGAPVAFVNVATDLGVDVGEGLVPANGVGFRGLPARGDTNANDTAAFGLVGKVGLGDLDFSDDGQDLWFTNLAAADLGTPQVYRLNIGIPPVVPTAADLTGFTIPDPGCVNGVARPWGIEMYLEQVYVGVVCTAENGGTAADLTGHIYRLDPLGGGAYVVNFDLDYPRGFAWDEVGVGIGEWEPWEDVYSDANFNVAIVGGQRRAARPQPIISDLEFDIDGTPVIALMDRGGHQLGIFNNTPDGLFTNLSGAVAGDTLRLCFDNGTYLLEANTVCPGAPGSAGAGNGQGPGNGEFYFEDILPGVHQETSVGSLAFLVGSGHVVASMMDPEHTFSGGLSWFNNVTGVETDDITLFRGTSPTSNTPGKGNGIGDIELGCPPAPIEIGNYVWIDDDLDGVQDPNEDPIPGVVLQLIAPDGVTVLASATTDAQGRYLFSSGAGVNTTSYQYGIAGLTFFTTGYEVRVALGQAPLLPYTLTVDTNDASLNGVMRDSNAVQVGANGIMAFDTGAAGANNHTYDVGFVRGMSLGNRVWFDMGAGADFDDGQRDAAEVGVAGVAISLFASDGAGNPVGPVLATDSTDANGFYLFDALAPGNYVARVDAANFTGGPLVGYTTSTPTSGGANDNTDRDDNGINDPGYLANGIYSTLITLAFTTEPLTEGSELSGNVAQDGINSRGLSDPPDNNSNLTVDFGFWLLTPPTSTPTLTPGTPGTPGPATTPGALTPTASGAGVTILKTANRVFARPGQDVTWTITVQNTTSSTISSIVVTDTIPSGLTIRSQQVTQGTATLSGLSISWAVGTLQPGESATLVISTLISPGITVPFRITNAAEVIVSQDINPVPAISRAQVVSISSLPATGEIPWWADTGRGLLVLLGMIGIGLMVISMGLRLRKR